jgi:hypothetical protein
MFITTIHRQSFSFLSPFCISLHHLYRAKFIFILCAAPPSIKASRTGPRRRQTDSDKHFLLASLMSLNFLISLRGDIEIF